MKRRTFFALCTALIAGSASSRADDDYWNQFRGPRGDGTSTAANLPVSFAEERPEIVWKIPVPGRAWASPAVWGNQIWLSNAPELQNPTDEKPKPYRPLKMTALCVDLETG